MYLQHGRDLDAAIRQNLPIYSDGVITLMKRSGNDHPILTSLSNEINDAQYNGMLNYIQITCQQAQVQNILPMFGVHHF